MSSQGFDRIKTALAKIDSLMGELKHQKAKNSDELLARTMHPSAMSPTQLEFERRRLLYELKANRDAAQSGHEWIVTKLTFKQYCRWNKKYDGLKKITKSEYLLRKAEALIGLQAEHSYLVHRLDAVRFYLESAQTQRGHLQVVGGNGFEWVDFRCYKIGKRLFNRSQAALKVV